MTTELTNNATETETTVEIAKLHRRDTQLRVRMSPDAVADYAEVLKYPKNGMPPITVFKDADGNLYLGDGFHRCAAAESIDRKNIRAVIRDGGLDDAILFAANCNRFNAIRWSNADKRHAVETLKNRFPKKPQRWIADQCGCSQAFVSKVFNEEPSDNGNSDTATAPRKTIGDKFADAAEKVERFFDELSTDGTIEIRSSGVEVRDKVVLAALERLVVIAESLGMQKPQRDHDDHADAVQTVTDDPDVIDCKSVRPALAAPDDDGEYADADDEPVPESTGKPKRGRKRDRLQITRHKDGYHIGDDLGELDDEGPFKTNAEAQRRKKELKAQLVEVAS